MSVDYDVTAVDDILDIYEYLMKKKNNIKVFFTRLAFLSTLTSVNFLSAAPLSCISMNNQECKVRPQIIKVNSGFNLYPVSIKTSKGSGSCNNINNLHAKLCFPDVVNNLKVKAFNLMSRTNETRHIE